MYFRRKLLEFVRHHCIAKAVENDEDIHSFMGFSRQVLFEFLTNRVAFPDVGFQVNAFLRGVNGGQHRIEEVAAIIIQL